jgi:hypothetical protein
MEQSPQAASLCGDRVRPHGLVGLAQIDRRIEAALEHAVDLVEILISP